MLLINIVTTHTLLTCLIQSNHGKLCSPWKVSTNQLRLAKVIMLIQSTDVYNYKYITSSRRSTGKYNLSLF